MPEAAQGAGAAPGIGGVSVPLQEIASWLVADVGAEFVGHGEAVIDRIGPLDTSGPSTITFLSNPKYQAQLASCQAGCVIVGHAVRDAAVARGATLVVQDPYYAYARLSQWWARQVRPRRPAGIHPSAVVDPTAQVHPTATVCALAVIEAGAVIGERAVIGSHAFIGARARVGADTQIGSNVNLGYDCSIGERGILHPCVVIGADGFGFAPHAGRFEKIEQLGAVRLGDDVEIGGGTCVDRGALSDTIVGNGVKIDNLCQIAHNVVVGDNVAMAAGSGVAGSSTVAPGVTMGGGVSVLGHLHLAEGVHISASTTVMRSLRVPGVYSGVFPVDDNASWEKNAATLRQLHALRDRIRQLEKKNKP